LEFEPVSVVGQVIEDGIGQGGIRNAAMPLGYGHLGDDQRGDAVVAIIQGVKQVLGRRVGQGVAYSGETVYELRTWCSPIRARIHSYIAFTQVVGTEVEYALLLTTRVVPPRH
jgi:hypothetical protein